MMARHLFLIAVGVKITHSCASGQPIEAIALEDAVDPCIRDFDAVVPFQVPDDPDRPQMILPAQIQNLLNDLGRRLIGRILWN